jgi:hypothetical protein
MKKIVTIILTVICFSGFAQRKAVIADLKIENLKFEDMQNTILNPDLLEVGKMAKFTFKIVNTSMTKSIPVGTSKLKISLGMLCFLADDLQGPNAPLGDYFHWSVYRDAFNQTVITGELYRDLPANFSGSPLFTFMPSKLGSSTIICQYFISNHKNPEVIFSDPNSTNNIISSSFTNLPQLTAKFIDFKANSKGCNLDLNWQISDEDKLTQFDVETSLDGTKFTKVNTVSVKGTKSYFLRLEDVKNSNIHVRIKAQANTGQSLYSSAVNVSNICNGRLELALYPNPVSSDITEVMITTVEGIFNGTYQVRLLNADGKELNKNEVRLINQGQMKYKTGFLPGGSYHLVITGEDSQAHILKFIKQ